MGTDRMFNKIDTSGDGEVSLEEAKEAVQVRTEGSSLQPPCRAHIIASTVGAYILLRSLLFRDRSNGPLPGSAWWTKVRCTAQQKL